MPVYKGLEDYKLIEKMGECVQSFNTIDLELTLLVVAHSQMFTRQLTPTDRKLQVSI